MQKDAKRYALRWFAVFLGLLISLLNDVSADEAALKSGLRVTENSDGFLVREGTQTVLQYQLKTKSLDGKFARSNYVHPLNDLDGNPVTEDFPEDHKHHRGIFWAWHQVWVGSQKIGDPWLCQDFQWVTQSQGATNRSDGSAMVFAIVDWQSSQLRGADEKPLPIAREKVEITVFPKTATYRIVEFRLSFQASRPDVRIGGSDDEKGYGGFSPRIKLNDNQKFHSDGKELKPVKNAIQAGPWVDVSDGNAGVAILTHFKNPGAPEPWILRRARSMQNARFPGRNPVSLPQDEPLVLRYQLIIHRGNPADVPIDELQNRFEESP